MLDITIIVICLIFLIEPRSTLPPFLPNVACDPYEGIIPVDSPTYRFTTYFVKLRHCQGSNASPNQGRVCLPTKEKKMNISVVKVDGSGLAVVTVSNHTACDFLCKNDASICTKYQTWNDDTCACDCTTSPPDCGKNKVWKNSLCDCKCTIEKISECNSIFKEIDPVSCLCIPKGRSSSSCDNVLSIKYVVIIMFVELVIVAAICALIFHRFFYTSNVEKAEEVRLNKISDKEDISA